MAFSQLNPSVQSTPVSNTPERVHIRIPDARRHKPQYKFIQSKAKRKIARAGRRGGKTTGVAIIAVEFFLAGRRVLYAAPTSDQLQKFWTEVTLVLAEGIQKGVFKKNESEHSIVLPGIGQSGGQRIRAKTAWNADTLRGDYADVLILDEYQLMAEDTWSMVGAPMLIDNNGDAIFIYTPPSLSSKSVSKAKDKRHASKLYAKAELHMKQCATKGIAPVWEAFHWTSYDNPFISEEGLESVAQDLTTLAHRQEMLAEDIDELPGALWTRAIIERNRFTEVPERLLKCIVGVDPPGGVTECGIVCVVTAMCSCRGKQEEHGFIIEDSSLGPGSMPTKEQFTPDVWAKQAITTYKGRKASKILAEKNFGGDMVKHTILTEDKTVNVQVVQATRGKAIRAEPVSALSEQNKLHFVGNFEDLEDELCQWAPGQGPSPNRLDAMVHAVRDALVKTDYSSLKDGTMVSVPIPKEFMPMVMPEVF